MLKALLVDDEENNIENLKFLLQNDCKDIAVVATANNGITAREWLSKNTVDVVFLDISMPGETGFEMLQKLGDFKFKVIFVTAHSEFALQAIKASAVDYVLKPVSITELQHTVEKLHLNINNESTRSQSNKLIEHLLDNINKTKVVTKIALPQLSSITFLDVSEIVSLQADSNYTIIHKVDMQKLVVTKTLKDFEDILDANEFIRIHKSHMINLKHVIEYNTSDGGLVKMIDGNVWSLSRRQVDLFLQKIKTYNILFFH